MNLGIQTIKGDQTHTHSAQLILSGFFHLYQIKIEVMTNDKTLISQFNGLFVLCNFGQDTTTDYCVSVFVSHIGGSLILEEKRFIRI